MVDFTTASRSLAYIDTNLIDIRRGCRRKRIRSIGSRVRENAASEMNINKRLAARREKGRLDWIEFFAELISPRMGNPDRDHCTTRPLRSSDLFLAE